MSAQVQINNVSEIGSALLVTGFIALTGNYTTGGDPLNFTTATADPSFQGLLPSIISSDCLNLDAWSMAGSQIGANYTDYDVVATKLTNPTTINPATGLKLKVAALGTPGTEHAAAAYESQYTGDIVAFMGVFTKLL